jgi:hypothetical protein
MRLELAGGTARQSWLPGDREARSVCHVHDGLLPGGGSVLLIGRDDGCLEIVLDRHREWTHQMPPQRRAQSTGRLHLDAWWARRTDLPVLTIEDVVECAPGAAAQYAMGVTAIAALPRPDAPDTIDLLVATRYPWLYVIEARAGALRLTRRMSMPGWIDRILAPRHPGGPITCLSRGGDLVRFTHQALLRGDPPTSTPLSILPTAAIWLGAATPFAGSGPHVRSDDGGLLVGTTTGLFLVRDLQGDQVEIQAVPVTRAGVLSLGAATVRDSDGAHDYITLGLDDGRLRIVTADLIYGRPEGASHDGTTQSFSVELGAAVLAEQALQPEGCPPEQAYVLAVLRDHSVRLFHVTSEQTQRALVMRRWNAYLRWLAPACADDAAFELEVASSAPPPWIEATHWTYMLVDVVLPRVCTRTAGLPVADRPAVYDRIAELVCRLVASADRLALHRLSSSLHALTGGDVRGMQRLSAAIVRIAVAFSDADAIDFVEGHLRDLNVLAGACADHDRPLLVFWMRFLRKYILRGPVFAAKRFRLIELVEQSYQARKHLDALIYQARLHRQGYDLRWEARLDDNVAAVHLARCSGCAIVVVVTASGRLVILDGRTGDRLAIADANANGNAQRDVLAPFEHHGEVRTLASAVVEDRGITRVVLSGDGARLPSPGLAVVDLSADPRDLAPLTVASVAFPFCDAQTRVHAIAPLPGRTDTFVVGLDTRTHPVGRLHHGRNWVLERAVRAGADDRHDDEVPQLAPGKLPTRAIAVVETDSHGAEFLAAAGSDDGRVLAFKLAADERATAWRLAEWDRVTDPIRSVVLGRHDVHAGAGSQTASAQSLFSCYLGTSVGDTLALSIVGAQASLGGASQPFGPYFAQALWRETQEAPMLAARLWQTSLFRVFPEFPDRVLVLVTEGGRMCIYHHAGTRSNRVSAQNNYYFRGLRLDRIVLPERVNAFALADGERDFVAATPKGQVYLARLAYPRGSEERRDPEKRLDPAPGSPGDAAGSTEPPALPSESWARLHQLFTASEIDEPFELPRDERAARKLELCELLSLDHGVLSAYALRERLTYHAPWDQLDASELRARARALLYGLRSDDRAHAERIKVILKSLCGAFLSRDPDQLRDEILAQPHLPPRQRAAIAAVFDLVHDDILARLTHASRGGARLAIVAMKELLRVPALRAMAYADADGDAVRNAVGTAVAACLSHDDRLVRTETLRAAAVMLRNVGVMIQARPDAGDRLLAALFPDGLAGLAWLLDPIIDGLLRLPGFTARTVLVSGAWYRVSVIAQLFWIFPDRTLTLCDHLLGRGLPVDVLALCVQTLRSNRVKETKGRIERWFLIPAVDPDRDRDRFIDHYQVRREPATQLPRMLTAPWHEIDDTTMAGRLAQLLDQLAQMWGVKDPEQLRVLGAQAVPSSRPPTSPGDLGEPPLATLEGVVARLAAIARDLAEVGHREAAVDDLRELRRPDTTARAHISRPIQILVSAIAEHWIDLCEPRSPEPGVNIGRFVLGRCIGEGGFGKVFEIETPQEDRETRVIKVLKRFTQEARKQFLQGARFNQRISNYPHVAQILEIVEPDSWRPAYLMRRYSHDLAHYLSADRRTLTSEWAADAAQHVGEALRDAHANGQCHGDVKPSNILVDNDRKTMRAQFFLADFDLSRVSEDSVYDSPRVVPVWLSQKCPGNDPKRLRQWLDLAALCLIAYRMLTGEPVSSDRSLASCTDRLVQLAIDHRLGPAGARLIATLQRVLELSEATGIDQFLRWLKEEPPPPPGYRPNSDAPKWEDVGGGHQWPPPGKRPLPTRILFLAANPRGTAQLDQLGLEVHAVNDRFYGRTDVELTKESAVRIEDLVTQLSRRSPDIVHFGGHGSPNGIVLHDDNSQPKLVTGDALARCLDGRGVALVVLNSCYSKHQSDAILPMVGAVVGTTDRVNDEAARRFSVMLYQQIFAGSTIRAAFRDACDTVGLHGLADVFHASGALDRVLVPRGG